MRSIMKARRVEAEVNQARREGKQRSEKEGIRSRIFKRRVVADATTAVIL
jgi:hypothetical protein